MSSVIRTIDREMVHNYRINLILPIPILLNEQASKFDADEALVERGLDYLYHLRRSILSTDYLEYRGCIIAALEE